MTTTRLALFLCGLLLASAAFAAPPIANPASLYSLNRANDATLDRIQDQGTKLPPNAFEAPRQRTHLNQRQRDQLSNLQSAQRRDLQMYDLRTRMRDPQTRKRHETEAIGKQHRYRLQQGMQLNRFQREQYAPPRTAPGVPRQYIRDIFRR